MGEVFSMHPGETGPEFAPDRITLMDNPYTPGEFRVQITLANESVIFGGVFVDYSEAFRVAAARSRSLGIPMIDSSWVERHLTILGDDPEAA
ncbi:hypothetical protein [Sphingobium boeckii]|uniref:Uncharacterized protein n=1 Tax=Sphingobium boeckii TaxID=1082345 RepID=A0A7W9EFF7_9SPHN|nr:hypothetical protein [Sphingobium boeckii]MBB5685656.1 hypothetical protein [Sphingobium boeckii]